MNKYYSTYISGLSSPIADFLKEDLSKIKIINNLDGLIEYTTDVDFSKIKVLPYLTNTFSIIKDKKNCSVENMAETIIRDDNINSILKKVVPKERASFRILISKENNLVSINNKLLIQLEQKITSSTRLYVNRNRPNYQFWILSRSEGITYFSIRRTTLKKEDKNRDNGELRPQLAYTLSRLSEPKENELFLDPFFGSGTIPLARASMTKKGLILASDNDDKKVKEFKEKVKQKNLKKKIVIKSADALSLKDYGDSFIHKIVTDPPWGYYEKISNIEDFYNRMLKEFWRILLPEGLLVLLIANNGEFEKALVNCENRFQTISKANILVSGKKANIYKMRKIKC